MALGKTSRLKALLTGGGVDILSWVGSGAAANTNIAIAGLKADAQLIAAVNLTGDTDLQSVTSIKSAGNIQTTSDTSADKLLVIYAQRA